MGSYYSVVCFIVAVCGDIMRMPGLPKEPQAKYIDIIDGQVEGLS